jgi:hypothetical protein
MKRLIAATHESGNGTKLPMLDVRHPVANGGESDLVRAAQFGSD